GTLLRPRVVAVGEQAAAHLLDAHAAGAHPWRPRPGSRGDFSTRSRGSHPEVFPMHRHQAAGAGDLDSLSAALEPGGRLLVREDAIGPGGLPVAALRVDR